MPPEFPSDNQAEEADLADGRKRFHGVDGGIYTSGCIPEH
jgi:hypothetical protein